MALTERLALIVSLDAQGAVRGLEKVGKAADRNLGKTEARIDRVAQRMQKGGAAMLAGAGLAAAGLYKAGMAASDLGEQVSQTEQIFGDASDSVASFAKSAAGDLGQSETAARQAANSFGLFFTNAGKSADEAAAMSIEFAQLASDMASFKNTSPEDAVAALGSALAGESEPMKRYGVFLQDATLKQRALEMGLISTTTGTLPPAIKMQAAYAEILEQTGTIQGDFARTSDSAANQMRIMNAEFENAKASLGTAVAPIMADVAGKAAGMASSFSDLNEKSNGLLSSFAAYGTIGLGAAGALSLIAGKALEARANFSKLGGTAKTLVGAGGIFAGIVFASKMLEDAFDGVAVTMDDLLEMDLNDLVDRLHLAEQGFEALGKDGMGPFQALARQSIGTAERLRDAMAAAGEDTAEYDRILREVATGQQKNAADQEAAAGAVEKYGEATAGATEETTDLGAALDDLSSKLRAQFDPLFGAQDALADLAEKQQDVADAEAEFGANSTEAQEARRELTRSALDYETALIELESAVKSGDVSTGDYLATLKRWVEQGYITQEAADEAAYSFGVLRDTAEAVPERVGIDVSADTSGAMAALDRLIGKLGVVQATYVASSGLGVLYGGPAVPRREHGGPVTGGSPYIVGERGPELFVPGSSGSIVSNGQMAGAASVNIYVSGSDPTKVVEAVSRYIKSSGQPAWLRSA